MKKHVFISIKEEYVNRILEGTKQIELRKSRPNVSTGDFVIIYCTSPVKAIVGIAKIDEIIVHSPKQMWKLHSKKLGISKTDFHCYYDNIDRAVGIVLTDVKKLNYRVCLTLIKKQLPTFSPPQTYKYFLDFAPPKKGMSFTLTPC